MNPKVMSTSSKLIVDALRHNGTIPSEIPTHGKLQYLNEAPKDKQERMLRDYTRVIFIRHPYARLYSAWTNKYRDMPGTCKNVTNSRGEVVVRCNQFYNNWVALGRKMLANAGIEVPADSQAVLRAVTWHIFLDGVLDGAAHDKHWKNQVRPLCLRAHFDVGEPHCLCAVLKGAVFRRDFSD